MLTLHWSSSPYQIPYPAAASSSPLLMHALSVYPADGFRRSGVACKPSYLFISNGHINLLKQHYASYAALRLVFSPTIVLGSVAISVSMLNAVCALGR